MKIRRKKYYYKLVSAVDPACLRSLCCPGYAWVEYRKGEWTTSRSSGDFHNTPLFVLNTLAAVEEFLGYNITNRMNHRQLWKCEIRDPRANVRGSLFSPVGTQPISSQWKNPPEPAYVLSARSYKGWTWCSAIKLVSRVVKFT